MDLLGLNKRCSSSASIQPHICSLSGEAKNIYNDIVVLERVLLTEIAIILRVPETACTHVEATVSLLEYNHIGCEFKVLIDVLQQFDDHL